MLHLGNPIRHSCHRPKPHRPKQDSWLRRAHDTLPSCPLPNAPSGLSSRHARPPPCAGRRDDNPDSPAHLAGARLCGGSRHSRSWRDSSRFRLLPTDADRACIRNAPWWALVLSTDCPANLRYDGRCCRATALLDRSHNTAPATCSCRKPWAAKGDNLDSDPNSNSDQGS